MKALILVADGFDDLQLFYPWYRLREEGVEVTLASPTGKPVTGLHDYRVAVNVAVGEVNPAEYDLLLIPGGDAPGALRLREEAVDVARTFMDDGRCVATICHGPQLLISACALNGRHVTCAPEIRDDVRSAGAAYHDESVVVDGNLVTCRGQAELAEFCRTLLATTCPSR